MKKKKFLQTNVLRFKKFFKDEFDWQESEFLRETRSSSDINSQCLKKKIITRVEQEHWYYNDYITNKDSEIFIGYDIATNAPVVYVQYNYSGLVDKRVKFDFFVTPFLRDKHLFYDPTIKWSISNSRRIIDTHRLEIIVVENNHAKIEYLNKFGFEIEGLLREVSNKEGKWINAYIMSLILS